MPLYLYSCRTCELELEELHPIGEAPAHSIRCPLCGGYFERDIAMFSVGGRAQPVALATNPLDGQEREVSPASAHGINCICCPPRR